MGRNWPAGPFPRRDVRVAGFEFYRVAYLYWRIRIPLYAGLAASFWTVAGAATGSGLAGPGSLAGLAAGLILAFLAEALFSYRRVTPDRPRPGSRPRPRPSRMAAVLAERERLLRRWAIEASPSPGGWQPPAGSLPGWNWLPPDGVQRRLDRMPAWVRLWSRTPFVDRYAHAYLWHHGGYDVLWPPGPPGDRPAPG